MLPPMLKVLRVWSLGVISILSTYTLIVLALSALNWTNFVESFWNWLGATGLLVGFGRFTPEQMVCFEQDDSTSPGCSVAMAAFEGHIQDTGRMTLGYLLLLLATAAVMLFAATRLERTQINALVIEKLRRADETYIDQILDIRDFDKTALGMDSEGLQYTQSVLAREASGGHGDARYSQRSGAEADHAMSKFTQRVSRYQLWKPLYERFERPTFSGTVQLAWRMWLAIFLFAGLWFALFSTSLWFIPVMIGLGTLAVIYLPNQRWKETYVQFSANDTNLVFAVVFAVVSCTITYVLLALMGRVFGNNSSTPISQWLPFLNVYVFVALFVVFALPLSNYFVYRHRANSIADSQVEQFFRTLLNADVLGTHAFAVCDSCMTPTILFLGQSHACEACDRPVDSAMIVRTVHV